MDNNTSLIQLIEKPLRDPFVIPLNYVVRPGDTLSKIITTQYDINDRNPRYKLAEASVLHFNRHVKDPNKIYPGQILKIMPIDESAVSLSCPVPEDFYQQRYNSPATRQMLEPADSGYLRRVQRHLPVTPEEQEAFRTLAWLQQNYDLLSVSSGSGFNAFGGIVSQANNAFIIEVKNLYQQFKSGLITENQYHYRRRLALQAFARRIGPFEKLVFNGQTAREAIRINRSKAFPATRTIDHHLNRLGRFAQYAKHGGLILSAAGVGMGCYNIAHAETQRMKNEILVETILGTAVGGIAGYGLFLVFASGPIGWVVALVLGGAAAIGSWAAGKSAAWAYDKYFNQYDLVKATSIDKLCK